MESDTSKNQILAALVALGLLGIGLDYLFKIGFTGILPSIYILWLLRRDGRRGKRDGSLGDVIGLSWGRLSQANILLVAAVAAILAVVIIKEVLSGSYKFSAADVTPLLVGYALSAMILPPLIEEFVYGGVLQGSLSWLGFGPLVQVAVPAVLFALPHVFTQETAAYAAIFGIAFGIIRLRTGSILWSLLLHAIWNGTVMILALMDGR